MKKLFIYFLINIMFFPIMVDGIELPPKTDHEKVNIYIFRGHGCTHCYDALEYFYENQDKYNDYFNIYTYEVWNNTHNSDFMQEVAGEFGIDINGVPFIVIGDDYTNTKGFSDAISDEIVEAAILAYQDDEYVDLVSKLAENHDDLERLDLEESCREEGIIAGKYDTVIILSILLVVIGGGFILIKMARK